MSTNSKISYRGMKLLAKKLGLIGETRVSIILCTFENPSLYEMLT